MTSPGQRRAVLYCRVSTDEQAERGTSLGDQADRCAGYCAERGWELVERFIDDGVSGSTTDRPALNLLLEGARQQLFEVLVVTDPDRLSRDLVDGLVIERELAARGVEVVYVIQPTMGTLERQLRGVIAEEERRKIRERTSRGLRAVAAAGHWPGGPPPYGYRVRPLPKGRGRLEIDPDEAAVLTAMINALVDDQLTTLEIAAVLNTREVPSPSARRRATNQGATRWTHRRVRGTLAAATCIAGTWTYGRGQMSLTIDVPPIVSVTRLHQLQDRLAQTSTGPGATARKHFFLFARRATSQCGQPMYGYARADSAGRTYRCAMSTSDRGPDRCDCRRVNAEIVESAAWETIAAELTDPERLTRLAGLALTASSEPQADDIATIERRIRRIEKALGGQIAELLAGGRDPAVIAHATAQLEDELRTLRQHRARLVQWAAQRNDRATKLDRVQRLAQSAKAALVDPSDGLKAQVVTLLDTRIRVLDTTPCPTCQGKGLLRRGQQPHAAARHHTGDICPTCHRSKVLPLLEISGLLPLVEDLAAAPTGPAIPFKLRSIG